MMNDKKSVDKCVDNFSKKKWKNIKENGRSV